MRLRVMWLLLAAVAMASVLVPSAFAEEPWERATNAARDAQDKALRDAARAEQIDRVVAQYMSQLSRNETPLNIYLVGRALFFAGRPEESIDYMKKTLQVQPDFWYADKGLARLYMLRNKQGDHELAWVHLRRARQKQPQDLDLIRLAVDLHMRKKEWGLARPLVDDLITRETDEQTRTQARLVLIEIYRQLGDAQAAANQLSVLVQQFPENPDFIQAYAGALAESAQRFPKDSEERKTQFALASRQFERLLRLDPKAIDVLQALMACYTEARNLKGAIRTVERMVENSPTPEAKKRAEEILAHLKEHGFTSMQPQQDFKEDPYTALVTRCLDDDPEVRHAALVEYFDHNVPVVPLILYSRLDPEKEPDPRCRLMIVRILGKLELLEATPRIATALWDPDLRVRRVATDELGRFTSPAMLIYLEPYFRGLVIEIESPSDGVKAAIESEYNAAREAMRDATAFRDVPIGKKSVTFEEMPANREKWAEYFETDLGQSQIIDAIEAFKEVKDPYPELTLLYRVMMEDDLEIVRAAYDVILAHADAAVTGEDEYMKARWVGFPRFDSKTITDETVATLRSRLKTFFQERRQRMRAADEEPKKAAPPAKKGVGDGDAAQNDARRR